MKPKRQSILINVVLAALSTSAALAFSELVLRQMGLGPMYVSPERELFWKYDARLGWAHQPGQEGSFQTESFRITVHINDKGLRDREHTYERPGNTPRILVMGDSFAWGYGVEEPERFSQRLEAMLGAEVINAGVSGYSTDQELLWYQDEGSRYDTDLVIVVFSGNDIGHNEQQHVYTVYYKPRFVSNAGELVLTGYPVPKTGPPGRFVYALSQRTALGYFLIQRFFELRTWYGALQAKAEQGHALAASPGAAAEPFALTLALLNEMRTTANSKGATFLVVATDRWWNSPAKATYADFLEELQSEAFLVLDVEALPGFNREAMLIPNDGHWSGAGHAFVAEAIADYIERSHLLGQPQ